MNKVAEQLLYAVLGLLGFALVWRFASGWAAWGVFLMLWSNNLQRWTIGQPKPKRSRYLGGWFCARCGADNADEDSTCSDKEYCDQCSAPRPKP